MGRKRAPTRLVLTDRLLDYLERCCDDPTMVTTDRFGERRIDFRRDIVVELIRMARFGKGLATLQAKPFAARSASATKAATARWDRVRAQRAAAVVQKCETQEPEKST